MLVKLKENKKSNGIKMLVENAKKFNEEYPNLSFDMYENAKSIDDVLIPLNKYKGYECCPDGFYTQGFVISKTYDIINFEDGECLDRGEIYGVCDGYEDILEKYSDILNLENKKFVVEMMYISKESQPEHNGWRWHKWGEYIGFYRPQCEYLYDEPIIEEVFCYTIYEIIKGE